MSQILIWLQQPIQNWFPPIFFSALLGTFAIFIAGAIWSSRHYRSLGLELESLPPDYGTYTPVNFVPYRFSTRVGITGAIFFLAGWLGTVLASPEWLGPALAIFIFSIPFIWVSFIARVFPLRCQQCGTLMNRFTHKETIGNGTIKTTTHHLCTHCKCATSDFTTD